MAFSGTEQQYAAGSSQIIHAMTPDVPGSLLNQAHHRIVVEMYGEWTDYVSEGARFNAQFGIAHDSALFSYHEDLLPGSIVAGEEAGCLQNIGVLFDASQVCLLQSEA